MRVFLCGGYKLNGEFKKGEELEKTLFFGIHGGPELRPDEKRRFLGFFRERVLQAVTFQQIRTKEGLQAMGEALQDSRGVELVIHQDARRAAMPLISAARQRGLDFTIVGDPKFKGEIAVLLAAKDGVDVPVIWAEKEKNKTSRD